MDCARLLLNAGADTEAQSNVRDLSAASVVEHAICLIERCCDNYLWVMLRAVWMHGADVGRFERSHGLRAAAAGCWRRQGGQEQQGVSFRVAARAA